MWLNMICLCAIYVNRNQQVFLAQMMSFVLWYDVIYHFFPIKSQYLMTWGIDSPVIGRHCCHINSLWSQDKRWSMYEWQEVCSPFVYWGYNLYGQLLSCGCVMTQPPISFSDWRLRLKSPLKEIQLARCGEY